MDEAPVYIRYDCPVCNHEGAEVQVSRDYSWSCPRCGAVGHWTLRLTAHSLVPSDPRAWPPEFPERPTLLD